MNYNKQLSDEIFKMYLNEKIGFNDICMECKKAAKNANKDLKFGPVPIFHIGKDYAKYDKRFILVGTVAYGWGELKGIWEKTYDINFESFEEIQSFVEERFEFLFFNKRKKRIFGFNNYALSEIYGSARRAFDSFAMTNLVHCNPSEESTKEDLIRETRKCCISEDFNGFIHKELDLLKPTHVIFLVKPGDTGRNLYLKYIEKTPWNYRAIEHPSSSGRTKKGYKNDIEQFLEN